MNCISRATQIDVVLDRIFELMREEASVSESKRYGSRDEGFDSPQLRRLREDAWIFDAEGSPRAASEGLRLDGLAPGYPPAPALVRLLRRRMSANYFKPFG